MGGWAKIRVRTRIRGMGGWTKIRVRTRMWLDSPSSSLREQFAKRGWEDWPRLLTLKGVKDLGLSSNPIHPGSCLDLGLSSNPVWRAESSHILVQNPLISHISHLISHLQQTILILYCSMINRRLINIMTTLP